MPMTERSSALLTDLYQINMMQAYLDRGATDTAVFELFARNLPPRRGALVLFSGTVTRLETMIRLPNSDLFRRNAQ
jgi:nicotinate phosphoribosyltransferase